MKSSYSVWKRSSRDGEYTQSPQGQWRTSQNDTRPGWIDWAPVSGWIDWSGGEDVKRHNPCESEQAKVEAQTGEELCDLCRKMKNIEILKNGQHIGWYSECCKCSGGAEGDIEQAAKLLAFMFNLYVSASPFDPNKSVLRVRHFIYWVDKKVMRNLLVI